MIQIAARRTVSQRAFHLAHSRALGSTATPSAAEIATLLEEHAKRPPRPLTLSTLLSFGRPLTPESVLASSGYVFSEIPRRFAMRVRSLEALPFIVGMNPFIARLLNAHRKSFIFMSTYPPVSTLDENAVFTARLEAFVQSHANDIPILARGFQECARYMSPGQITQFLDGAIHNRIAVRLIAEQHIALSRALAAKEDATDRIGVVDLRCSPHDMIRMCGSFVSELCEATLGASPEIIIDGDADATFAYVPVHIEYILTEILKNAFRASVERHSKNGSWSAIPPIVITVARSPYIQGSARPAFLSLRIRDQGGGVTAENMARIFSYSFTTAGSPIDELGGGPYAAQHVGGSAALDGDDGPGMFGEMVAKGVQTGVGTIAGLGYGLPMSRLYASYFGGSLEFLCLDGWGSDIFLRLRSLDGAGDIEI